MNYDDLGFTALMAGTRRDYINYDLQGKLMPAPAKRLLYDKTLDTLEVRDPEAPGYYRTPKLKREFRLTDPLSGSLRTAVGIVPSLDPSAPAGAVTAVVHSAPNKYFDHVNRSLRETLQFTNLSPKQALALIENIKKNPELAELMDSEAFYDKAHEVNIKPDRVKKVLDKWFDTAGLDLKPGTPIKLFDGPDYKEVQRQRLLTRDKLKSLLKIRKFRNLGLLTAGAGAAGATGSLWDNKDRMLSAGLSTAAGAAALPTGLAAFGGKKLNRLMTRKPLLGLATGALGGLGGFFGNKAIQDELDK